MLIGEVNNRILRVGTSVDSPPRLFRWTWSSQYFLHMYPLLAEDNLPSLCFSYPTYTATFCGPLQKATKTLIKAQCYIADNSVLFENFSSCLFTHGIVTTKPTKPKSAKLQSIQHFHCLKFPFGNVTRYPVASQELCTFWSNGSDILNQLVANIWKRKLKINFDTGMKDIIDETRWNFTSTSNSTSL